MDPRLLADWIERLGPGLVLFARQHCAAAEDVVQDAFFQLARQSRPPDDVRAWLFRVVRNAAISQARAESRRRRHETQAAAGRDEWFLPCPETDLDGASVAEALQRLEVDLREVIVAHLWGGMTFGQIGNLFGISDSTAHRRYLSGLAQLRQRLEAACPATHSKPTSER